MITHDFCHFSLDMTKHHSVGIRDRYTKLLRTGTWFIKYGRKTCIVTAFIQLLETTRPSRSWTNFVKCPELTFEILLSALSVVVMMRCSGNCSGRLSEYLLLAILLRLTACTIMKWCGKGKLQQECSSWRNLFMYCLTSRTSMIKNQRQIRLPTGMWSESRGDTSGTFTYVLIALKIQRLTKVRKTPNHRIAV